MLKVSFEQVGSNWRDPTCEFSLPVFRFHKMVSSFHSLCWVVRIQESRPVQGPPGTCGGGSCVRGGPFQSVVRSETMGGMGPVLCKLYLT